MKQKLYEALAQLVGARSRCVGDERAEWRGRHEERIQKLVRRYLPHGSGFDNGTEIDLEKSTDEKLVFSVGFHHMDEHGSYDGWTEHRIIVKPSLSQGFSLRVTGRDRNEIKDYIAEIFALDLNLEIDNQTDQKVAS